MDNQQADFGLPTGGPPGHRARRAGARRKSGHHRPSFTAPSTGLRSTSGRTGHSLGTRRSVVCPRTSPTGRRLNQHRSPPSTRINTSRTRNRNTTVRADARDRHLLRTSRTQSIMRTTRAGFCCLTITGLKEGCPHDGYACFDTRDILWARRVFHIERMRNL